MINVKAYNVKGDGITDDTLAIQTLLDAYPSVYFPEGTYRITRSIVLTNTPITLLGDSPKTLFFCDFTEIQPGIIFRPDKHSIPGHNIGNFCISGQNIEVGILLDVSDPLTHIYKLDLHHVFTYGLNCSISLLNPIGRDGFFTSTIKNCWLDGGIQLERCGDSVSIHQNTITGNGDGILLSNVEGAAQCVISENNITTKKHAIILGEHVAQLTVSKNQCEKNHDDPIETEYMIIITGTSTGKASANRILENNLNDFNYTTYGAIGLHNADDTSIISNYITRVGRHVYISPTCSNTLIEHNYKTDSLQIEDNGLDTRIQ